MFSQAMTRTIRKFSRNNSNNNSNKTSRCREMVASIRGRVPAPVAVHPSREQKNPRRCVLNRSLDRSDKIAAKIPLVENEEEDEDVVFYVDYEDYDDNWDYELAAFLYPVL